MNITQNQDKMNVSPVTTSTLSAMELGEVVIDKLEGLIGQIYFCLKITSKCILRG
jgi:hypothetical protein